MSEPVAPPASPPRSFPRSDLAVGAVVFGLLAALFWPLARALALDTYHHDQLLNGFILLVATVAAVLWREGASLRPTPGFTRVSLILVALAVVGIGVAVALRSPLALLASLVPAVAGWVIFLFPDRPPVLVRPVVLGLAAFLAAVVVFPVADWPLREVAGMESARLLQQFGLAPSLGLAPGPEPKLLLVVGTQVFEVAAECNGFGLILSSTLLALVLATVSRASLVWRLALVPLAALYGWLFNLGRILVICVLAPHFPGRDSYDILHETVGTLALWLCLALVWWLAQSRPVQPAP